MTGFGLTGINKTQEAQLIVYENDGSGLLVHIYYIINRL
jgi:hypothetical protein